MKNEYFSVAKAFNAVSYVYDFPLLQSMFYGRIQNRLLDELLEREPKAILDAGCGTGQLLVKMESMFPDAAISGIDISENMLEKARTLSSSKTQCELASVYELPFESNTFDLITNTISSHFYLELETALNEFYRCLQPGGILAMANMTNGLVGRLPGPFKDHIAMPGQKYLSSQSWLEQYEKSGFKLLRRKRLIYPVELFICQK